jgi:hypothetical protein
MECPICYEGIAEGSATTTTCGHVYHSTCLSTWLERASTCPTCRHTLAAGPSQTAKARLEQLRARYAEAQESIALANAALEAALDLRNSLRQAVWDAEWAARREEREAAARQGAATRRANRERSADEEAARRARRSEAARRGAATRAANRAAATGTLVVV